MFSLKFRVKMFTDIAADVQQRKNDFTVLYYNLVKTTTIALPLDDIRAFLTPFCQRYIWHHDAFECTGAFGSVCVGESTLDEWYIVHMMLELTAAMPMVRARVWDTDGEFVLIMDDNEEGQDDDPDDDLDCRLLEGKVYLQGGRVVIEGGDHFGVSGEALTRHARRRGQQAASQPWHRAHAIIPCALARALHSDSSTLLGHLLQGKKVQEATHGISPSHLRYCVVFPRLLYARTLCRHTLDVGDEVGLGRVLIAQWDDKARGPTRPPREALCAPDGAEDDNAEWMFVQCDEGEIAQRWAEQFET